VKVTSEHRAFDGKQLFCEHDSSACGGPMRFAVYLPPAALAGARVPAVYVLAGLSSTEETFAQKAGAQRVAAALGLALIAPDTSPRATRIAGDDDNWDFGLGAGFYLDATVTPWSRAYRMRSWVADELPALVAREFPVADARSIMGHSMGGHGALTLALTYPERYRSVSALAPIVAPSQVPWGEKAFTRYLGPDRAAWAAYDTVALLRQGRRFPGTMLVDQGSADKFLDVQLKPQLLAEACAETGQPLALRVRDGYDHGYFFVATFVEEHLHHHARALAT
jgi:S-formylglutathione hydrolase